MEMSKISSNQDEHIQNYVSPGDFVQPDSKSVRSSIAAVIASQH